AQGCDPAPPILQFESLRGEVEIARLARLRPDLIVVVAYGLVLPRAALDIPRLGCVNLHASLLPRWRGAAPIQRAIEAGDAATGVSLMQMDAGLDTGAILAQARIPIAANATGGSLCDELATLAAQLLGASLPALAAQTLTAMPQDERHACRARKLARSEAQLDWRQSAVALERKVRAFNPTPMARVVLARADERVALRVLRAKVGDGAQARAGEILRADADGIAVATGGGMLVLTELQKPGGAPMSAAALLNGMHITPGMRFVTDDAK
ncbi:MAG: methionyl-tRNA formyltransferase, partial [bacterium]